jgi:hypothetical protein
VAVALVRLAVRDLGPDVLAPIYWPRYTLIAVALAVARLATDANSALLGLSLVLAMKLANMVRLYAVPSPLSVAVGPLLGPGRVLPILGTIFGGVPAGVALGFAWLVEVTAYATPVRAWLRMDPGAPAAAPAAAVLSSGLEDGTPISTFLVANEWAMLVSEYTYTVIITIVSCYVLWYHESALARLGDALDRRRVFISNMVRQPQRLCV